MLYCNLLIKNTNVDFPHSSLSFKTLVMLSSQIHFFLTLDIMISFAPSALCHLIQRV